MKRKRTIRNRSSSACCAGFTNLFKRRGKHSDADSQGNKNPNPVHMRGNQLYKQLQTHFTSKLCQDRQFMLQLVQQGGIAQDMMEYLNLYFTVKNGDFVKSERDLISVTFKKVVAKERRAIQLLNHLVEQPKLKRYEQSMRFYLDRQKDELRVKLGQIVTMLNTHCMAHAENAESRSFFLCMIGDFYRYQVEMIKVEEYSALENLGVMQKKARRDRDQLIQRANEAYYEAFKLAI